MRSLTFGPFTQMSDSGPHGPLIQIVRQPQLRETELLLKSYVLYAKMLCKIVMQI